MAGARVPEDLLVHLRRAHDEIDRRYAEPLDLDRLAATDVVGYSSLGSFSSRFRRLVGASPSKYQARWAECGAPRIPGCFVFMHGLSDVAIAEKPTDPPLAFRAC